MRKEFIFLFVLGVLSCTSNKENTEPKVDWTREKSRDLGKEMAIEEELYISLYTQKHKEFKFSHTGTGLQYVIIENAKGDSAKTGTLAYIDYKISLLDGTECYKTEGDHFDKFIIDHSDVQSGIQEGLKKLAVGDSAKFIIPSHLANGLIGDLDKIPPQSPILVDVKLLEIKK